MPLKLKIISFQRLSPGQETIRTLEQGSITIGRASQNDWVLEDPERILSSKHCSVHYQNGHYILTDTSTNGTFLNDAEQRIARNQSIQLADGDRFILGEYEILVTIAFDETANDVSMTDHGGPMTDVVTSSGLLPDAAISAVVPSGSCGVSRDIMKSSHIDILSGDKEGSAIGKQPSGAVATEPPADILMPDRAAFEPPKLVTEQSPISPNPGPGPEPAVPPDLKIIPRKPIAAQTPPLVSGEPPVPDSAPVSKVVFERPATAEPLRELATPEKHKQHELKVSEPAPEAQIPEDWWMQPPGGSNSQQSSPSSLPEESPILVSATPVLESPVEPEQAAKPVAKPRLQVTELKSSLPEPPVQDKPGDTHTSADELIEAFFNGAGLPPIRWSEAQKLEAMANLGAILRETVQGLMDILMARSDIKGEFRLDRTAISPIENNPLKTPPGRSPLRLEEVMALLLIGRGDTYMPSQQAVRESFSNIKDHQLAVIKGIQAALDQLTRRLDPDMLEGRLKQNLFDNILSAGYKAKCWDLFVSEYQSIVREAEDDFNKLFGDEFARAYEERLRGD